MSGPVSSPPAVRVFSHVAQLLDVDVDAPAVGEALVWDGTHFVNSTVAAGGGDVDGGGPDSTFTGEIDGGTP